MKTKHINKIKKKDWLNTSKCGKYSAHFSKFCSVLLSSTSKQRLRWEHNGCHLRHKKPHGGQTSLTNITVPALHPSLVVLSVGDRVSASFTQDPKLSPDTQSIPLLPTSSPLDIQSEWSTSLSLWRLASACVWRWLPLPWASLSTAPASTRRTSYPVADSLLSHLLELKIHKSDSGVFKQCLANSGTQIFPLTKQVHIETGL